MPRFLLQAKVKLKDSVYYPFSLPSSSHKRGGAVWQAAMNELSGDPVLTELI